MAIKSTLSPKEAREAEEAESLRRARAARQAAKRLAVVEAEGDVTVRVLKLGDGKISMGQHVPGIGEVHYEAGEEFQIARSIAEGLEARGYVEIKPGE